MLSKHFGYFLQISLLILLAVSFSNYPSQADEQPTQEHQFSFDIPYVPLKLGLLDGEQPLVKATLNDTQAATFLVDTGATVSIISSQLAKQMNLYLEPGVSADGKPILWGGKQVMTTKVPVLQVGQFRFLEASLLVLDAKDFSLSPTGHDVLPYQGILGASFLDKFAVVLDSQDHRLVLIVPGNLSANQVGLVGFTQSSSLPLSNGEPHQWLVPAQLTNGSLKGDEDLVVDTGSDSTDVSEQLGRKINLKALKERGNKTAYGTQIVSIATVDQLSLGGLTLRDFPLTVRPVSKGVTPVLGMDILSGYRVLIDFPGKKMYLQSNTAAAVPAITIGPAPAATAPPAK